MAEAPSKKALKQFLNLAIVAYIDGKLEENELTFLRQKQRQLGISDEEARKVLSLVVGGKRDLASAGGADERQALLTDAAEMALADGVLQQGEFEALVGLAKRLGGTEEEVERTLARVMQRVRDENAPASEGVPPWVVHLAVIAVVIGAVTFLDLRFFWR